MICWLLGWLCIYQKTAPKVACGSSNLEPFESFMCYSLSGYGIHHLLVAGTGYLFFDIFLPDEVWASGSLRSIFVNGVTGSSGSLLPKKVTTSAESGWLPPFVMKRATDTGLPLLLQKLLWWSRLSSARAQRRKPGSTSCLFWLVAPEAASAYFGGQASISYFDVDHITRVLTQSHITLLYLSEFSILR